MESFFSRLRRFEATHGQISGTCLHRYANDAAWRENNRMVDDRRRTTMVMRATVTAPRSRSFSGYWQRGSANPATTSSATCSRRSLELYPAKMTTFDSGRNYIRHERGLRASINECESPCLADLRVSLSYVV
jgi:hypothetical protein